MEISKIKISGVQNPIDIKDTVARADIESIKEDAESEELAVSAALNELNSKFDSVISSAINITYEELKAKRDNSQLVPGQWYRITDYITTTVQANTQSAGHAFDVIVMADANNKLNENAYAALHSGDTYFANSKLEAWQLKYCLDNDTNRFAWADSTNGKGVIYRMIDEFNNDVPYDFKNIQYVFTQNFVVKQYGMNNYYKRDNTIDITINGTSYYGYVRYDYQPGPPPAPENLWIKDTLSSNVTLYTISNNSASTYTTGTLSSISGDEFTTYTFDQNGNEVSINGGSQSVFDNNIDSYIKNNKQTLNVIYFRIIGYTLSAYGNSFKSKCHNIVFGNGCYYNSFGDNCNSNTFGNNCGNNSFGNNCNSNTFGFNCINNSFGNECYDNSFGDNCTYNSFMNNCNRNSFGDNCTYNSFGINCNSNSFGNYYSNNSFGDNCNSNTFGNNCGNNSFGNSCNSNTFGNECSNNSFGNDCHYNSFMIECRYNSFGNSCGDNTFGNLYYGNSFGNECCYNSFRNGYKYNSFGDGCSYIVFQKDYIYYVVVENGNQYIDVTSTQTTSSSNKLQNFTIAQGVNNTSTKKTISHDTVNDTFQTIYQPANSQVISV